MKLLPIFNRNAEMIQAEPRPIVPQQNSRHVDTLPTYRGRERSSIDLLRNLYDEIMPPLNNKADPRISKFRTSFYLIGDSEKTRVCQ